jgi:hypothetical protein
MKNNNNGHKKQSTKYNQFSIIHHYNSPNEAITVDGKTVRRETKLWYAEYDDHQMPYNGRFIMCAPDSEHFIYADPMWKLIVGRWHYMCSCSSPAVITGYNAYKQHSSPSSEGTIKGEMLCCKHFLDFGRHVDKIP